MTAQVTVAIPFCSEEPRHFALAVRSVFAQTLTDWRLLLVGDSANENLIRMARSIQDERVQVCDERARRGLAARLNQSVEMTLTDFYVRMDADDVMFPDRIERQLTVLRTCDDVDVVGARAVVVDEDGSPEGILREAPSIPATARDLLRSNLFTHPSVAGRTRWFRQNRYSESIKRAEDKELWLRTYQRSGFRKLSDPLLFYRVGRAFNRRKASRTALDDALVSLGSRRAGIKAADAAEASLRGFAKLAAYQTMPVMAWPRTRSHRIEAVSSQTLAVWANRIREISDVHVEGWLDSRDGR